MLSELAAFKVVLRYLTDKSIFREECSNKGGTEDGDCAQGYGVCCTCKHIFIFFQSRFKFDSCLAFVKKYFLF